MTDLTLRLKLCPSAEVFYPVPMAELPRHLEITPWDIPGFNDNVVHR